jgi:peptidoglycan glycosyltransferase
MARVAASVGNHGAMPRSVPIVKGLPAFSGEKQVIREEDARRLARDMRAVVTQGTAVGVFNGLRFGVAGKTGSAENSIGDGTTHSWFIGFAPYGHPRIAFAVIVENGGYGREVAAPIVRDFLESVPGFTDGWQ